MLPLLGQFLGAAGLSVLAVKLFEFLFGGLLSPFRIFRRRATAIRHRGNSGAGAIVAEELYKPDS
jgi:hypothetical protein